MSEETQPVQPSQGGENGSTQPNDVPETKSPEDVNASEEQEEQPESLSALRGRLMEEKVRELREELGDEDFLNIVEFAQKEVIEKFNEVDNRSYKDLDGVLKTFSERRNLYEELQKLKDGKGNPSSSNEGTQNNMQNVEQGATAQPNQEVQPNGVVSIKEFNKFAKNEILKNNPEFEYVKEEVEKVATASNASIVDVWEGEGDFSVYNFKSQAAFKKQTLEDKKAYNKTNQAMPSMGGGATPSKKVMSVDEFIANTDKMTGAEIEDSINRGLVSQK